jgi:hypothetical protein
LVGKATDLLTVTRFQLSRGVLQTVDLVLREHTPEQSIEVVGLVLCVEAYPPVSSVVKTVVVDGKEVVVTGPTTDPLATLKTQLRSQGPDMGDFANPSSVQTPQGTKQDTKGKSKTTSERQQVRQVKGRETNTGKEESRKPKKAKGKGCVVM